MPEERLVGVDELGKSGVAVVDTQAHGKLAVGMSNGEPFAVSNKCRHLFASLGDGQVSPNGSLVCPSHGACFDVATGKMTKGPGGAFRPVSGVVKATMGARKLKTYPVEVRDDAIWLTG